MNGACRLLFNLLHFTMSIIAQELTFPGIFQSVTNCNNTKHISPLPVLSNLENDFALFQIHDAKWVSVFEHVDTVKLRRWDPGPS